MPKQKTRDNNETAGNDRIEQAYEQALRTYSHRQNLTAIDKGFKYLDEERTNIYAIRFHVNEKIGLESLSPAETFPTSIFGVPTDVIEATYVPHQAVATPRVKHAVVEQVIDRRRRFDQLQPGISVAHKNVTAGTLGMIVYDKTTGRPCILSNWHVLVGSADALPGDPIVQPGPADGGRPTRDTVAQLERSILGATGDAAIGVLNKARSFDNSQLETGVKIATARMPKLGEILEKSGRTTGVTHAKVDGLGRYFITYSVGRVGVDGFKLVPVDPDNPNDEEISSGGDSGSLWYSPDSMEGVGLHFGGETDPDPKAENALACHLPSVLRELNITLIPPVTIVSPAAAISSNGADATPGNGEAAVIASHDQAFGTFDIDIRIRIQPQTVATN